jgi:3-hydroxybutyrate dehydrogenase
MQDQVSKSKSMPLRVSESKIVADVRELPLRAGDLAGKAAIVTGSTSGIGLGIARAFAAAGMNVMLNGLGDAKQIESTRAALEEDYGVKAAYSAADVSKPDDIVRMVEDARQAFGMVDVLVNNAGIQHVEAIETFPVAKWDAIIAIDLSSAFHGIRAVVPEMKARKWGRIINIASAHGLVASPFKSAYVTAKHGLLGLTKTVALETAEYGITANAICPGYVLTPLVQKQIPETAKARGITEEQVIRDVLLLRDHRADRCAIGIPLHRGRGLDHRHRASHRGWMDGAMRAFARTGLDHAGFVRWG